MNVIELPVFSILLRTRTLDRSRTLDHIRRLGKGLAQESLAARQPTTDYNRLRTTAIRRAIGNIQPNNNAVRRNIRARSRLGSNRQPIPHPLTLEPESPG
jgi:hypothetical protein